MWASALSFIVKSRNSTGVKRPLSCTRNKEDSLAHNFYTEHVDARRFTHNDQLDSVRQRSLANDDRPNCMMQSQTFQGVGFDDEKYDV